MEMNSSPLSPEQVEEKLSDIKSQVSAWLVEQRLPDQPFGSFRFCRQPLVPHELNAATCAIELWVMLGLPCGPSEGEEAMRHLQAYQNPETGLVVDPTWGDRQLKRNRAQLETGDSFFTMTTASALRALGATLRYPIKYLADMTGEELLARTNLPAAAHNPLAIGDYGTLIAVNRTIGAPHAEEQWMAVNRFLVHEQDEATGLWPKGGVAAPYTPAINRAFHLLRTTWNVDNVTYPHADRMIDACLAAADDPIFYDWQRGYACNDLDLAVMFYSASRWSAHRRDEVARWALSRLPLVLAVQKPDGGFTFGHERQMTQHAGIRMSEGRSESDMWGTLMYMGTIKMMVELGYEPLKAPWRFSQVHAVPRSPDEGGEGEYDA